MAQAMVSLAALMAFFKMPTNGADEDTDDVLAALRTFDPEVVVGQRIMKEHYDLVEARNEARKAKPWSFSSVVGAAVGAFKSTFTSPPATAAATLQAHAECAGSSEDKLLKLDVEQFLGTFIGRPTLPLKVRVELYKEYTTKKVSNDTTTRAAPTPGNAAHICKTFFHLFFSSSLSLLQLYQEVASAARTRDGRSMRVWVLFPW